jgi:hypothetical protein
LEIADAMVRRSRCVRLAALGVRPLRSIGDLAEAGVVNFSYTCRVLRLTLLSPKIVETILDGRVVSDLSLNVLLVPHSTVGAEQDLKITACR